MKLPGRQFRTHFIYIAYKHVKSGGFNVLFLFYNVVIYK